MSFSEVPENRQSLSNQKHVDPCSVVEQCLDVRTIGFRTTGPELKSLDLHQYLAHGTAQEPWQNP